MKKILLILCLTFYSFANSNGWNTLHQAVFDAKYEKVKKLLKTTDIESTTNAGLTALHIAVKRRDLKMVKLLITNDADIDSQDKKGFSPLYYAVLQNRVKIARFLLNNEADPNLANQIGNAPIHNIAYRNRFEMLDLFINYDVNLKLKNKYGLLPYHFAQKNGHGSMMRELRLLTK